MVVKKSPCGGGGSRRRSAAAAHHCGPGGVRSRGSAVENDVKSVHRRRMAKERCGDCAGGKAEEERLVLLLLSC